MSNNYRRKEKLNIYVIISLLLVSSVAFFYVVNAFFVPIVLSLTFTILFHPLYKKILTTFRNKKTISALICCFILLACLFIPIYLIIHLVTIQSIEFYKDADVFIKEVLLKGESNIFTELNNIGLLKMINIETIDWQEALQEGIKATSSIITNVINKTSMSIFGILANLFLILFTMFYFFKDGNSIIEKIRFLSPLRNEYEEKIISGIASISRATIKGTVVIGLIQGVLGAATFLIFGFKGWVLWGVIMVILSIIPVIGSYIIMVPAAIIKMTSGHIWQGLIIIIIATVVNYGVDYLLRPRLVGHESKMHDLIVFFSTLGGLAIFGVMGFIIGPFIAVLFFTLLEIYGTEFKEPLTLAQSGRKTVINKKTPPTAGKKNNKE